jgi:AcrR family transcriptional regulator
MPPATGSGSPRPPSKSWPSAGWKNIARHAGVNIATAYRHFANKHELARSFLADTLDQAAAITEEAAAANDPWAGLTRFLEQITDLITSNRCLPDLFTPACGTEWLGPQPPR